MIDHTHSGYATSVAQVWYDNLTVAGNTSLNPFFYGTYLGETKKNEPVTRNKNQAFQADAVGAMKQLGPEHFKTPHTFRLEWQPGRGGRLDWFTKSHKTVDENGTITHVEGDGKGKDWEHSLHIPDSALENLMGSKIPEEPSYIILNTAISSTWAFPYSLPDWCSKCYDCDDPKCQCSFNPGFCAMLKTGKVTMKIDSVRVYQSKDNGAHSGQPHRVGCDPVEFPTREYIKGYEYRYMRNPPFVYDDLHPLREVQYGGGDCTTDVDCGGGGVEQTDVDEKWTQKAFKTPVNQNDVLDLDSPGSNARESQHPSLADSSGDDTVKAQSKHRTRRRLDNVETKQDSDDKSGSSKKSDDHLQKPQVSSESLKDQEEDTKVLTNSQRKPKGTCVASPAGLFGASSGKMQCKCNQGYTGPHCLSIDKYDDAPGAYELKKAMNLFDDMPSLYVSRQHITIAGFMLCSFLVFLVTAKIKRGEDKKK